MKEDDARYILVTLNNELCALIHFRFLFEDRLIVYVYYYCIWLFRYEIQVYEKYKRKGLGKRLMKYLTLITLKYQFQDIKLTVFKVYY